MGIITFAVSKMPEMKYLCRKSANEFDNKNTLVPHIITGPLLSKQDPRNEKYVFEQRKDNPAENCLETNFDAIWRLREVSRQTYLHKREIQKINDLKMEIEDEE